MISDFLCHVQIVTAQRGGAFSAGEAMCFGSLESAIDECEALQADFDADAEPSRVYLLDADKIPVWAAGAKHDIPQKVARKLRRGGSRSFGLRTQ